MSVRDAINGFYAMLDRDDEALARAGPRARAAAQVGSSRATGWPTPGPGADRAQWRRVCDDAGAARSSMTSSTRARGRCPTACLGQTDLRSRRLPAGSGSWIGISHNLDQVRAACEAGADYLGFGPVFATATKQHPDPVQGLDALRAAVAQASGRPIVAIGGITAAQVGDVYRTGVHAVCAIRAVNDAPDPRGMAQQFARRTA